MLVQYRWMRGSSSVSWQRDTTWKPIKPDILQMHLKFRILFFFFFLLLGFLHFHDMIQYQVCQVHVLCSDPACVQTLYNTRLRFRKQLVSINKTWVADLYLISTWQWVPPPQPSWMFNQNTDSPSVSQSSTSALSLSPCFCTLIAYNQRRALHHISKHEYTNHPVLGILKAGLDKWSNCDKGGIQLV